MAHISEVEDVPKVENDDGRRGVWRRQVHDARPNADEKINIKIANTSYDAMYHQNLTYHWIDKLILEGNDALDALWQWARIEWRKGKSRHLTRQNELLHPDYTPYRGQCFQFIKGEPRWQTDIRAAVHFYETAVTDLLEIFGEVIDVLQSEKEVRGLGARLKNYFFN